jgi:phenylacetate-CoA ligase
MADRTSNKGEFFGGAGVEKVMLKEIIKDSPKFIKKPAKIVYSYIPEYIRQGQIFRDKYNFLEESQYWPKQKLEEYQMLEVKKLIDHAYNTVPYYTKLFSEYDIMPDDIQDFNDLKKIPYLTKEIIQNNLKDLVSTLYDKKQISYVTTGGSTGIPMGFYIDKKTVAAIEAAFMYHQLKRVGFDVYKINKSAVLRGNVPAKGIYEHKGNQLILSSFQLTDENMKIYTKLLENFKPDFIQAYPSSIDIFSNFIINNNIKFKLPNLKAILCGSENLYDFQRKKIEMAFSTRVYSWYGHTEVCCLAGECEKSNYYHIFSEYGYTELINENGQDVQEEDEVGEIVATGFNNYAMPFIRYKTCDMAVNTNEICSCGRNYNLIKRVEGRKQDYFIDKFGNKITFTCSDDALWRVNDKIFAYQYIQNEAGKVMLIIEPKKEFESCDYECIRQDFLNYYPNFQIEIKLIKHIERTKRGKFRYLVQNIKI